MSSPVPRPELSLPGSGVPDRSVDIRMAPSCEDGGDGSSDEQGGGRGGRSRSRSSDREADASASAQSQGAKDEDQSGSRGRQPGSAKRERHSKEKQAVLDRVKGSQQSLGAAFAAVASAVGDTPSSSASQTQPDVPDPDAEERALHGFDKDER